MSSNSKLATEVLWTAQPIMQWAVAVVLWRRKAHKQFPMFFAYLIFQIVVFAVTYPLRRMGNYEWYFWVYWLTAAGSAVLGFKIIHEVFLDVFRPFPTLKDLGTVVFKWAGVVMLMVSVVVAFSNATDQGWLVRAVTTLESSVRLVQCGLILFLLLFSQFLGVSKRQQSFGIALGFGLVASVELILLALISGAYVDNKVVSLVNIAAYNIVILIWLAYALARNAVRETAVNHLQTQRWERGLADLHSAEAAPGTSHSLIPMFEGMVERAISRSLNPLDLDKPLDAVQPPSIHGTRPPSLPAAAAAAGSKSRS